MLVGHVVGDDVSTSNSSASIKKKKKIEKHKFAHKIFSLYTEKKNHPHTVSTYTHIVRNLTGKKAQITTHKSNPHCVPSIQKINEVAKRKGYITKELVDDVGRKKKNGCYG